MARSPKGAAAVRSPARADDPMAEVRRWEDALATWLSKRSTAEAALAQAESTSGEDVLENPTLVAKTAADMRSIRDEIELASKAADAARTRLDHARVVVLEREAQRFDQAAAAVDKKLATHREKTSELLAALEAHEGVFVPQVELMQEKRASGTIHDGEEWSFLKSDDMANEAEQERMRAAVIRDVAAGVDPRIRMRESENIVDSSVLGVRPEDLYPSCVWGPGALIPAPLFSARIEAVLGRLAAHDAEVAGDDAPEIARRQAEIDRVTAKETAFKKNGLHRPVASELAGRDARIKWIEERKQWRADAPKRREAILDELEALTGSRDETTADAT